MLWKLTRLSKARNPNEPADGTKPVQSAQFDLHDMLETIDQDPYLAVVDIERQILSVFDDLRFDRSDADIMAGPMRNHIALKLSAFGFRQVSGHVIENAHHDLRMIIPKFRALGESPFDAIRYTPRRPQDFYILTPTQAACQIIDTYSREEAQDRILTLIQKHPINIYRILDFMDRSDKHMAFRPVLGHLKFVQRKAIRSEPLCRRRALR
ncbi:MAG: hypothetical protein MK208_13945 [Shimia sp.]|jgi:hypothetical protein|uniref:hypothetical protein n=1 Tax=Shimia sp. TaxID=1954381 RepID=UPI0025D1ABA5|nr:hypothetical protein [Shimia sp.]MCH2068334.1 hypothetical protein [Shimia sp.]